MTKQRGNILFLILLAVVLFAALSYAVTSGMRGGGNNASKEKISSQAASIIQGFDQLDTAVMRMTMTGGLAIENISFELPLRTMDGSFSNAVFSNSNCTSDTCRVFKPSGGGISPRSFEDAGNMNALGLTASTAMPGYYDFLMMQWPYAKTDANDIVVRLLSINPDVCQEVARALSIPTNISTTGPLLGISTPSAWDSTVRSFTDLTGTAGKTTLVSGSTTSGGSNACTIFHLVYAR